MDKSASIERSPRHPMNKKHYFGIEKVQSFLD